MITLKQIAVMLAFACAVTFAACARSSPHREYSLTLWNWDPSCAHLSEFKRWAQDFKAIGGTEIYISAAWKRLEPMPGHYRFGFIARRLAVARKIGLRLGVRINSYWGGATPSWLHVDKMEYESGKVTSLNIPSINDPRFWRAFSPLCTHLAEHFRGQHVDWCAFIGSQAENKYGSWCTFDPASLKLWRKTVRANPRPRWLARIVGDAPLPQTPPVPGTTHGTPDRTAADMAFIAFRQENWRTALKRFNRAIRAGDPKAGIVVQLGESYRSGSAEMSNLDYYGMSRGADKILQSYDFDLNAHQGIWKMQADLATFQGITLKPVVIEFDDPVGMAALGYTPAFLTAMGKAAVEQGCGIEECNAGGYKTLPSGYSYMKKWGQICETAGPTRAMRRDARHTILLYVSKWANYCYREPTRWLNLAQFGAWRMLKTNGYRVRIICGDDLKESLNDYRGLYVAFSPEQLIPMATRRRLLKLESVLPTIVEVKNIPRKLRNQPIIVENFAGRTQSVLAAGCTPAVDLPSTRWRFYSQDAAGYLHSPMRVSRGPEAGTHSCRTNFNDAAYIRLRKLGHDHLPGIITVRAQVQVDTADRVGVGFYSKPPRDATDGFSGFFINHDNGQLQLCVDGNLVGPPRPAPFLGWQAGKFYTVSLSINTHTGEVASLSYDGHDMTQEFNQPIRGFGKSSTAYAGFFGWSGSSASATGYVANFEVLGHGATFSGHAPGIGTFARYVPGLPIAPELSHPVRLSPRKVILGYPLAYIWNSGLDHAAQQRVLLWAIRNTWGRK